MEVRLLGPLAVWVDGSELALGGPKQRAILALLALQLGRVVSVDELIDAAWEDALPANPANALQHQVAQLRKALPDFAIETVTPGYRLDEELVTTDLNTFRELLPTARAALAAGDEPEADRLVSEALGLWRGPALADFAYDDFAQGQASRLESERLAAVELSADIDLRADRTDEAIASLTELTADHPLREGLWTRLAVALYRAGRQPDALRALQQARQQLIEVGLEASGDLDELEGQILARDQALRPAKQPAPNNLPVPPNATIGRQEDLERVDVLLSENRLVTLLGPGGAGKTRLAIEVARQAATTVPGRIWFVALDALDEPELLAAEIGRVTGMRENPERPVVDQLVDHLCSGVSILVLDNCEHLLEPVAELCHELLLRCGDLQLLATSQAVLRVGGEVVFAVAPLAVPGTTPSIYDPIGDVEAVALFYERAGAAGAHIDTWASDELAAIANIVATLDGMPLAIELAAARTRSMSPTEIAIGLEDRFEVLDQGPRTAPDRQRSLRGAMEWSLGLLDSDQRTLLGRLSVLVGDFTTGGAAEVGGESLTSTQGQLAELVDRSLVIRRPDRAGQARFALLESLRRYGLSTIAEDELVAARLGQLRHATKTARDADAGICGGEQLRWMGELDAAYENIRSALAWALEHGDIAAAAGLAQSLGRYWDWRGLIREGSEWTSRISEAASDPIPGLATVRAWLAYCLWEFGDITGAQEMAEQAMADAGSIDAPGEMAGALSVRMLVARSTGALDDARSYAAQLVDCAETAGDPWLIAWADSAEATVFLAAGDLEEAEARARRSIARFAELGDRRSEGWGRISLAQIELERGDADRAGADARAALVSNGAVGDERNVLWASEIIVEAALATGEPDLAARVWAASQPLRDTRGVTGSVNKLAGQIDLGATLRDVLGDEFDSLSANVPGGSQALLEMIDSGA